MSHRRRARPPLAQFRESEIVRYMASRMQQYAVNEPAHFWAIAAVVDQLAGTVDLAALARNG